jgi:hypothetical protein
MDTCGLCKTDINPGAVVCVGCQGKVVYGATRQELSAAFNIAFALTFFVLLFPAFKIGFSLWGFGGMVAISFVAGFLNQARVRNARSGQVRTFRRF